MKTETTPARANVVVLKQLLNLIPRHLIGRHARETKVEAKARTFGVISHLAAMLFAQLSQAISLDDVCDWRRLKAPVLARFGVVPPSRNTLSHANKERDAAFIEKLSSGPCWTISRTPARLLQPERKAGGGGGASR